MKTIRGWLETLPEPYRTQAIENATRDGSISFRTKERSLSDALCEAFVWSDTPQGREHWKKLHDEINPNEPQPTTP
jgi:hypothetical protein